MPADNENLSVESDRPVEGAREGAYETGLNPFLPSREDFQYAGATQQENSRAASGTCILPNCDFYDSSSTTDRFKMTIEGLEPNEARDSESGKQNAFKDGRGPLKDGTGPLKDGTDHEPSLARDKVSDNKLNDLELSAFANEIAARLKNSPGMMNDPDLSKILQRAAENNQLKSLISCINRSLLEEGSSRHLEFSEEKMQSRFSPDFEPFESWSQFNVRLKDRSNSDNTLASMYFDANHKSHRGQFHKS